MKNYFEPYLDKDEIEQFAEWAFGDYDQIRGSNYFRQAWNERHGSAYFITLDGKISQDAEHMVNLWKEQT